MPKSYTVDGDYSDSRLDKWFKNNIINLPHSLLEKILRQNKVKVNKKKVKSSYRLQIGDLIEIYDISRFKPVDKKEKIKYLPKKLTKKDKKIQKEQLILSRKKYKKGKYIHRKPVKSYKSKKSKHILNAMKIYKINNLSVNDELSKKTGCTKEALNNIVKKGRY